MEIVKQVEDTLAAEFPGSEIKVEYDRRSRKVSGFLIWGDFDTLDQVDRQRQLGEVLRSKLGPMATKVSMIFTYTPREYRAMMS